MITDNLAASGEIWCSMAMKIYQAHPDFARAIARIGLSQAELARLTRPEQLKPISVFTLAHIAKSRQNASEKTASRIARVYASVAGVSHEEAMAILFIEVGDRKGPERRRGQGGKFITSETES
jgi:hypothetical protein